jgi:hypothetical protein
MQLKPAMCETTRGLDADSCAPAGASVSAHAVNAPHVLDRLVPLSS